MNHEEIELLRAVQVVCGDHGGWAKPSEVRQQLSRRGVLVAGASTQRVAGRLRELAERGVLEPDVGKQQLLYRLPPCKHCNQGHVRVPEDLCEPARMEYAEATALGMELGIPGF